MANTNVLIVNSKTGQTSIEVEGIAPFRLGKAAFFADDAIETNPYANNTPDYTEWNDGWTSAETEQTLGDDAKFNTHIVMKGSVMKGLAEVVLDEINLLRANVGLSERTLPQLKSAVRIKMRT